MSITLTRTLKCVAILTSTQIGKSYIEIRNRNLKGEQAILIHTIKCRIFNESPSFRENLTLFMLTKIRRSWIRLKGFDALLENRILLLKIADIRQRYLVNPRQIRDMNSNHRLFNFICRKREIKIEMPLSLQSPAFASEQDLSEISEASTSTTVKNYQSRPRSSNLQEYYLVFNAISRQAPLPEFYTFYTENHGLSWAINLLDKRKLWLESKAYKTISTSCNFTSKPKLTSSLNRLEARQESSNNISPIIKVVRLYFLQIQENQNYEDSARERLKKLGQDIQQLQDGCFCPEQFYFIPVDDLLISHEIGCLSDQHLIRELIENALEDHDSVDMNTLVCLQSEITDRLENLINESEGSARLLDHFISDTHNAELINEIKLKIYYELIAYKHRRQHYRSILANQSLRITDPSLDEEKERTRQIVETKKRYKNEQAIALSDFINGLKCTYSDDSLTEDPLSKVIHCICPKLILKLLHGLKPGSGNQTDDSEVLLEIAHRIVQSAIADSLERRVNYPDQARYYLKALFWFWKKNPFLANS